MFSANASTLSRDLSELLEGALHTADDKDTLDTISDDIESFEITKSFESLSIFLDRARPNS